jgi:mannose-6-phosphate isomerase-like protein (cupin superfamily)
MEDFNELYKTITELFPSIENSTINFFLDCCTYSSKEIIERSEITLKKPYGLNHILLRSPLFGVSFVQINKDQGTSYHYHTIRKEFFLVKNGELTLIKESGVSKLRAFEVEKSTPHEKHSLKNRGEDLLEILEIFTPPLLNDKVRVQDSYDRKLGDVNYME